MQHSVAEAILLENIIKSVGQLIGIAESEQYQLYVEAMTKMAELQETIAS